MPFSDEKSDPGDTEEVINTELLVLNQISREQYLVCYMKRLIVAEAPCRIVKRTGRSFLPYGSIINTRFLWKRYENKMYIENVKSVANVNKLKMSDKWSQLSVEFCPNTQQFMIICNCLTNGCFTYQNIDYSNYAVFNDVLGIISDQNVLPKKQIGRLICSVVSEERDGRWQLFLKDLRRFEKVYSLSMSAQLNENEFFGLVTREECEDKRDLRLVSSRDFPRDVRIFKCGTHCCHPSEKLAKCKPTHDHIKCVQIGVNNVHLLGKSIAMKMKACFGMSNNNSINTSNLNHVHEEGNVSLSSPEGFHVDGRSLRNNVTQLSVTVHGGFVEIETISEYSGLTDHNGFPLLWSHDVEFVVDFSKIFQEKPSGLYTVKVVRFHRPNVFAKWRLARRSPIVKSLQTKFHSRLTHSVTLAFLNSNQETEEREQPMPSTSRFGLEVQSCCLPRTDSLDNVELFDALVLNSSGCSTDVGDVLDFEEDESLWKHYDDLALKIIDDTIPPPDSCK